MQYVTLGKTGLKISRVGFGGIPIQRIDAEKAKPLIDALIECGINYIDTARGYTVSEDGLHFVVTLREGRIHRRRNRRTAGQVRSCNKEHGTHTRSNGGRH